MNTLKISEYKAKVRRSWLTISIEINITKKLNKCNDLYVCVCVWVHSVAFSHRLIISNPMDCSPLSMVFSWQVGSQLPFPSPGDLPNPGIKPSSPALAGGFFTTEPPGKPMYIYKPKYTCQWYLIFKNGKLRIKIVLWYNKFMMVIIDKEH